ncbi:isochorismate synthase [Mycobacterium sp. PO1]|nr:isochorismate synthase [Mycobacterium sp. PO1]GFM22508.1 isochorismate synthase [Mycobacterium sp. PO2]
MEEHHPQRCDDAQAGQCSDLSGAHTTHFGSGLCGVGDSAGSAIQACWAMSGGVTARSDAPAGSPDHTGDRSQITSGGGARTVRNAVVDTPS